MRTSRSKKTGLTTNTLLRQSSLSSVFIILFPAFSLLVLQTGIAYGAEGATHAAEWKEWLWKVLNFAVLVVILVKFLGKPLKAFLKQRTELIEKTLKEAREARELAEQALAEIEGKLRLKDRELQDIMTHTEQAAKKEQAFLIKQGESMKDKIIEQTKNNIAYDLKLAKDALKAEAVELSMELAEKELKEKLPPDRQLRLVEEALANMETRN